MLATNLRVEKNRLMSCLESLFSLLCAGVGGELHLLAITGQPGKRLPLPVGIYYSTDFGV